MQQTKDQELVKSVHKAIEQEMETLGLDINISAHDGEIALVGIVDWLAEKEKAEEISKRVPGVVNVENGLTIALDGELTDHDLEHQIMKKLEDANLTEMGVRVHEGIVTMMGHAESDAEEQAKDLIRHVRGIKEIVSKVD